MRALFFRHSVYVLPRWRIKIDRPNTAVTKDYHLQLLSDRMTYSPDTSKLDAIIADRKGLLVE